MNDEQLNRHKNAQFRKQEQTRNAIAKEALSQGPQTFYLSTQAEIGGKWTFRMEGTDFGRLERKGDDWVAGGMAYDAQVTMYKIG